MKTVVINIFGGPGAGKSSTAYMLAGYIKWMGVNCELVTEYAKDVVWESRLNILDNQFYISAKQHQRVNRLIDKVDYIVTDSPLLLGAFYGKGTSPVLKNYLLGENDKFKNVNFLINRGKEYLNEGRLQTEEEAKIIDKQLKKFLTKHKIEHTEIEGGLLCYLEIYNLIFK